jgi:hypothetical protein
MPHRCVWQEAHSISSQVLFTFACDEDNKQTVSCTVAERRWHRPAEIAVFVRLRVVARLLDGQGPDGTWTSDQGYGVQTELHSYADYT